MTYPGTLLKAYDLLARKELGQNFLTDPNTAEMIAKKALIERDDVVLEIGSGLGALTVHAASRARKVYAVEKDKRIIQLLKNELAAAQASNVEVINDDIFNIDLAALANGKKLIVIGNLPYNISSKVLFHLVENRAFVDRALLMFQKELAQRIVSPPGGRSYGRLSAVVQYCADVKPVAEISANLFFPKPEVESSVIQVTFKETSFFPLEKEAFLFKVIKAAFSQRRKTLRNSLSGPELGISKAESSLLLEKAGIDPSRRAETLTVNEFIQLTSGLMNERLDD